MKLQRITEYFGKLFQSLFSLLKILLLSKFSVQLKKSDANNECVVLGNGPCLTDDLKSNREFIVNRKKFCVNLFAYSDEYVTVKPEYYVLAAPEFFLADTTELHKQQRNKLAKELIDKTDWQMVLFSPFSSKNSEFIKKISSNNKIKIVHFNTTPIEGFTSIVNLLFKLNLGIPRPHNVLIPSLFLALNSGFKKIFIFGADHSWHEEIKIDEQNKATVNHQHFYDKNPDRFPMYKLDGKEYRIHDIFRKLHLAFLGYFTLKNYSEYLDSTILNASSKSYIDAFEKIQLNK